MALDFGLNRIFSCGGPKGWLWREEVSEKSGKAGVALVITHLMLGRKLYSQSQHAEQAAVWQKGGRVFILSCLAQSRVPFVLRRWFWFCIRLCTVIEDLQMTSDLFFF